MRPRAVTGYLQRPAPTLPRYQPAAARALARLFTRGIHKASIEGAVVDPRLGPLIVGQDLSAGYVSQDGIHFELYLSESIVLSLDEPQAICTIRPA